MKDDLLTIHALHAYDKSLDNYKNGKMEDIKEYFKYYIGCECLYFNLGTSYSPQKGKIISVMDDGMIELSGYGIVKEQYFRYLKPILRRLWDISEEDARECYAIGSIRLKGGVLQMKSGMNTLDANQFHYLLTKGYWLFGDDAFDKGLVIDAKTIENK